MYIHVPLSLWMASLTTLSHPTQHILTLSSTVCNYEKPQYFKDSKILSVSLYIIYDKQ